MSFNIVVMSVIVLVWQKFIRRLSENSDFKLSRSPIVTWSLRHVISDSQDYELLLIILVGSRIVALRSNMTLLGQFLLVLGEIKSIIGNIIFIECTPK